MFNFSDQFIQRVVKQDEEAFAHFYEQTADVFFRYLKGRYFFSDAQAQDLISDFYLKCRKGLTAYNPEYKFETYVWTILKNHAKDYFKKKKSLQLRDEHMGDASLIDEGGDQMLDQMQTQYRFEQIHEVMHELDEGSYEVIHLRYIEELGYDQMGEMLNLSHEAVRQRLSRALKKVRNRLERQ